MKKYLCFFLLLLSVFISSELYASSDSCLSVMGLVKQPLNLTTDDLSGFQTSRVQLNEIMKDGTYSGAFFFKGIPLRTLLDTAFIQKEETAFNKKTDLAVIVRNRHGKQVALSWGEIYYSNSNDILVALSASPIKP